jgi:hypothetical protein
MSEAYSLRFVTTRYAAQIIFDLTSPEKLVRREGNPGRDEHLGCGAHRSQSP